MPGPGHSRPDRPEKNNHLPHINAALSDALSKWEPADGTELTIKLECTVVPNPGGIRDYRVVLEPA